MRNTEKFLPYLDEVRQKAEEVEARIETRIEELEGQSLVFAPKSGNRSVNPKNGSEPFTNPTLNHEAMADSNQSQQTSRLLQ